MAKAKESVDEASELRADQWSPQEIQILLQDMESQGAQIRLLTTTLNELQPIIDDLRVTMSVLNPVRSEVPPEVAQGVPAHVMWSAALQGCLIGLLQVCGPSVTEKQWESHAAKAVAMAETVFRKGAERFGRKTK